MDLFELFKENTSQGKMIRPINEWEDEHLALLFDIVYREITHRSINKDADLAWERKNKND